MGTQWTDDIVLAQGMQGHFYGTRTKQQGLGPALDPPSAGHVAMPKRWQQLVMPRRDQPSANAAVPNIDETISSGFFQAVAARASSEFIEVIERSPDYVALVDEFRAGPGGRKNPKVAALWWSLAQSRVPVSQWAPLVNHVVDGWVADAGIPFAIEAVVESVRCGLFGVHDNSLERSANARMSLLRTGYGYTTGWNTELRRGEDYSDVTLEAAQLQRLRRYLAGAELGEWIAARDFAEGFLQTSKHDSCIRSFLFPTETEWLDEYLAHVRPLSWRGTQWGMEQRYLLSSVTTLDQLQLFTAGVGGPHLGFGASEPGDALPSLLEVFGAELGPWLIDRVDTQMVAEERATPVIKDMITALALIGDDPALEALVARHDNKYVAPVLQKQADKCPAEVARAIATTIAGSPRTPNRSLVRLLQRIVGTNEAAAAEMMAFPSLAEMLEASGPAQVLAADDVLPTLLVEPPWVDRKPYKPRVLDLAPIPIAPVMMWGSPQGPWAEREPILLQGGRWAEDEQLTSSLEMIQRRDWRGGRTYIQYAPIDDVHHVLQDWSPEDVLSRTAASIARALIARLGMDAVPYLLELAEHHPSSRMFELQQHFGFVEFAWTYADRFHRLKSQRDDALQWLLKYPEHAGHGLVPIVVGGDMKKRAAAASALRAIAADQPQVVDRIALAYGQDAASIVAEELAISPMELLPARMPKLPDFLFLDSYPLPVLADGSGALSQSTAQNLLLMLAISTVDDPYPGVDVVMADLDRASTSEFLMHVFTAWQDAGYPAKHSWILIGLGLVGDDTAVRRIAPLVRAWPHEGAAKRAQVGIDALGAMGSELAMMQLFTLSEKGKTKGLKQQAAMRVQRIADARGLTQDQLHDRLIPDLGLNEDGTRVLDFGPRQFTVGFDEMLKPFARDSDGKPYKSLPRKTKTDDEDLAKAAAAEFNAIKKDVKVIAKDQLQRFEVAMVLERRWTCQDVTDFFVTHPLMRHLATRLIWGVYDNDAAALTFRVAEDGSFADVDDNEIQVAPTAVVGVLHPIQIDPAALAAWGEVFSDYELLQPFEQLGRATFTLTEAERTGTSRERFKDREASVGRVLGLRSRGWTMDPGGDFTRPIGPERYVHLSVGGIEMTYFDPKEITALRRVWVTDQTMPEQAATDISFGEIGDVAASELLLDLARTFG